MSRTILAKRFVGLLDGSAVSVQRVSPYHRHRSPAGVHAADRCECAPYRRDNLALRVVPDSAQGQIPSTIGGTERLRSAVLHLATCLTVFALLLLSSPFTTTSQAEPYPTPTIRSVGEGGNWTDPDTWSKHRAPASDDVVAVSPGTAVVFDAPKTEVQDIRVAGGGALVWSYDTPNSVLTVRNIIVEREGFLAIGHDGDNLGKDSYPIPANHTVTIRFRARVDERDMVGGPEFASSDSGLWGAEGSFIEIVGSRKTAWSDLAQDARAGSDAMVLATPPASWKAGDEVMLSATEPIAREEEDWGFSMRDDSSLNDTGESEARTIEAVDGRVVTLTSPLQYTHSGPQFQGRAAGEVGNLTRNVTFTSADPRRRGHTFTQGAFWIRYARFDRLGPFNKPGRYPVHVHELTPGWDRIEGNAVTNSGNTAMTLHGTANATVKDNVIFNGKGHGIYLFHPDRPALDHTVDNNFVHNLVGRLRGFYLGSDPSPGGAVPPLGDVHALSRPTAYWFANPTQNNVSHNAAFDSYLCYIDSYVDAWGIDGPAFKSFVDNDAHGCLEGLNSYYVDTPGLDVDRFTAWHNGLGLGNQNFHDRNFTIRRSLFYQNKYSGAALLSYATRDNVRVLDSDFIGNQWYAGLQIDSAATGPDGVAGPPHLIEGSRFSDNAADLRINSLENPQFSRNAQVVVRNSVLGSPRPIMMPGRDTDDPSCTPQAPGFCNFALSPTSFVRLLSTRIANPEPYRLDAVTSADILPFWMWPDQVPRLREFPDFPVPAPREHSCPFVSRDLSYSVVSPMDCGG